MFAENDVDLDLLARLTEDDLRQLGVPFGPRKKIIATAVELKAKTAERSPSQKELQPASTALPERRQITVMFADVVDSTSLSGRVDAEDLRSLMLAYQEACTQAVESYGGYVAQYLVDGVIAYFGYPQAHEDDAIRAVRAAFTLLEQMPEINRGLLTEYGVALEVRAGLHTGLVVTGEVGGRTREQLAIGETPNIAARVQGIAAPGTLVVSDTTWSLVDGFFTSEPLGPRSLKGVNRLMSVYREVNGVIAVR